MNFLDLQNGFYNVLLGGLGLQKSPVQLVQPSPPLPAGTPNSTLWAFMNNIPPFSLTQNYISSGGNQIFSDYQALFSALQPSVNINFDGDIGPTVSAAWQTYLNQLTTIPGPTQLPQLFMNWAFSRYPSVAVKGSSDLSRLLLDPIGRAQMALMPYTSVAGSPARQPDWSEGYAQLVSQLASAPSRSFSSTEVQSNSNVSTTWTGGAHSGFFGLWSGSASSSAISEQYAASAVSMQASFAHVTTFTPSPGSWYDSGALGLAYSNKTGSPWGSGSSINWNNTFGSNGNMQRVAINLIAVEGMSITVTSSAVFSASEQTTITQSSSGGLWPFYSSSSGSSSHTGYSFNSAGHMTTTISSLPGVPVVIGIEVLPIGQYLGHATAALEKAA